MNLWGVRILAMVVVAEHAVSHVKPLVEEGVTEHAMELVPVHAISIAMEVAKMVVETTAMEDVEVIALAVIIINQTVLKTDESD